LPTLWTTPLHHWVAKDVFSATKPPTVLRANQRVIRFGTRREHSTVDALMTIVLFIELSGHFL
jgi:nicotinic acid phosphoribosyltransferase